MITFKRKKKYFQKKLIIKNYREVCHEKYSSKYQSIPHHNIVDIEYTNYFGIILYRVNKTQHTHVN